jgi:hypothetical protein
MRKLRLCANQQRVERRASPRVRFGGAVLVSSPERRLTCAGGDLSDAGMLLFPLKGDATATVGESVEIKFTLPRLYRWLTCEATVVREAIVQDRRAWGVAFEDLPSSDREVVRVYVAATQQASA